MDRSLIVRWHRGMWAVSCRRCRARWSFWEFKTAVESAHAHACPLVAP